MNFTSGRWIVCSVPVFQQAQLAELSTRETCQPHASKPMTSSSQRLALFTVGSTVSLSVLSVPAQADATGTAADLLPLDSQDMAVEVVPDQLKAVNPSASASIRPETSYSPDLLRSVADNVNGGNQEEEEDDTPDIGDLIDLSFIEQFIDENGDVNLPLGITVYEAMGTTSIGFGGKFR